MDDLFTGMNSLVYARGICTLFDECKPLTCKPVTALQSIVEDAEVIVESLRRTGSRRAEIDLAVLSRINVQSL